MILVHSTSMTNFNVITEGNAEQVYTKLYEIKNEKKDGNWIMPMSNRKMEWHNRYDGGMIEGDGNGNYSQRGTGEFIEAYYIFFTKEAFIEYFDIKEVALAA